MLMDIYNRLNSVFTHPTAPCFRTSTFYHVSQKIIQPVNTTFELEAVINTLDEEKKLNNWQPHEYFNATKQEILHIVNTYNKKKKGGKDFHKYLKIMENKLIHDLKIKVDQCHDTPKQSWFDLNRSLWRNLALLRDLHDFICGRDKKHHIRTDDCRRFIPGIIKLFNKNIVINPVYRILTGCKKPNKFIHPLFIQFNN